jgi:hypothetical protein
MRTSRFIQLYQSLALSVPISLFAVFNYEVNLTVSLLPLVAISILRDFGSKETILFFVCAVAGALSCVIANFINPDGLLWRHLLSLTLILVAPGYIFLGRETARNGSVERIVRDLSFFSSIFSIALVLRIIYVNEPVRIQVGPEGYSVFNAVFLGLPVFGTFGVLSLAHLVCVQAFICAGVVLSNRASISFRILVAVGLACLLFLILGSNARSAQIGAIFLLIAVGAFWFLRPASRRWWPFIAGAICVAAACMATRHQPESRLVKSLETIAEPHVSAPYGGAIQTPSGSLTTGRSQLIATGIEEFVNSPFIGNGFGTYGRFKTDPLSKDLTDNSSTHIYPLTIAWKGGLLFAIPFFAFLFLCAKGIWNNGVSLKAELFFSLGAILITFLFLGMTWDILIVPSAGALVYFLAGLLSVPDTRRTRSLNSSITIARDQCISSSNVPD